MHPHRASGALLIGGALTLLVVAASHPTGHDLSTAEDLQSMVRLNAAVHGVAILGIALLIAGCEDLHRRLEGSAISMLACVLFAVAGAAALSAAVTSGFIAPEILARQRAMGSTESLDVLAWYSWRVNQGFARVHVGASAAAILLWSASLLRLRGASRGAGIFGLVTGAGILIALLSGRLTLNVHGFGAVMLAESVWLTWMGVLLMKE